MSQLGPLPCLGCRKTVVWQRIGHTWFIGEVTDNEVRHHYCRPRCEAVMRDGRSCYRKVGHFGHHAGRETLRGRAAYMRDRYRAVA